MKTTSDFAEFPYPGESPNYSHIITDFGKVIKLEEENGKHKLVDTGASLDSWIQSHGAELLKNRIPVLSYGSNKCPQKVLRNGISLPAIQFKAKVIDHQIVWCRSPRKWDDSVPATILPKPGSSFECFVTMVEEQDFAWLERSEGYPVYYSKEFMPEGSVFVDGVDLRDVVVFVGVNEYSPFVDAEGLHVEMNKFGNLSKDQENIRSLIESIAVIG